jgi:hypothetical protein
MVRKTCEAAYSLFRKRDPKFACKRDGDGVRGLALRRM